MLQDWRRLFRQTELGTGLTDPGDPEHLRQAVAGASLDTPLTQIGFSTRALNAQISQIDRRSTISAVSTRDPLSI